MPTKPRCWPISSSATNGTRTGPPRRCDVPRIAHVLDNSNLDIEAGVQAAIAIVERFGASALVDQRNRACRTATALADNQPRHRRGEALDNRLVKPSYEGHGGWEAFMRAFSSFVFLFACIFACSFEARAQGARPAGMTDEGIVWHRHT